MALALYPSKGGNSFAKGANPSADSGDQGLDKLCPQTEILFKEIHTPLTKEERDNNTGLSRIPRKDRTHLRGRSTPSTSSILSLKERYRNKKIPHAQIHDCRRYSGIMIVLSIVNINNGIVNMNNGF
jgi:hypothetical protein